MKFQKTLMLLFVLICCLTGCGKDKMTVTADLDKNNSTVENETIIKSEQDKEVLMEEAAPEYEIEGQAFDDYNSDGYLDIKVPHSTGTAGKRYFILLQNPDTGRFETEETKIPNY